MHLRGNKSCFLSDACRKCKRTPFAPAIHTLAGTPNVCPVQCIPIYSTTFHQRAWTDKKGHFVFFTFQSLTKWSSFVFPLKQTNRGSCLLALAMIVNYENIGKILCFCWNFVGTISSNFFGNFVFQKCCSLVYVFEFVFSPFQALIIFSTYKPTDKITNRASN